MRFLIKRTSLGSDFATYERPYHDAELVPCFPSADDSADTAPVIHTVTVYTVAVLTTLADRVIVGRLDQCIGTTYLEGRTIENLPALRWLEKEGITHFVEIYDGYRE